jgi:hypothetical protein
MVRYTQRLLEKKKTAPPAFFGSEVMELVKKSGRQEKWAPGKGGVLGGLYIRIYI